MALAPGGDGRALADRIGHQRLDLFEGWHVDQRPLLDTIVQPVADHQLPGRRGELFDEGIMDAGLHIEAVGADAGLPAIAELGLDGALHGPIDIGVVKDDEGGIAAQFHRYLLDRIRRLAQQQLAHFGRAGEGELAHQRVGRQLAAHLAGRAGEDIDHAIGETGLAAQLAPGQARIGRLRCGLGDNGAADRQRRADLAG